MLKGKVLSAVMMCALIVLSVTSSRANYGLEGAASAVRYTMSISRPRLQEVEKQVAEALNDAGGYNMSALLLNAMDLNLSVFSGSVTAATLFVPSDAGVAESGLALKTFNAALPILQYHVATERLSFQDLQRLDKGYVLKTLLAGQTLLITDNSEANFTVDDVRLSHPDIYMSGRMAVHGIDAVLNASIYGHKNLDRDAKQPAPPSAISSSYPIPAAYPSVPAPDIFSCQDTVPCQQAADLGGASTLLSSLPFFILTRLLPFALYNV